MVGSITEQCIDPVVQQCVTKSAKPFQEHLVVSSDPDDLVGHHSAHSCQQIASRAKNSQRPCHSKTPQVSLIRSHLGNWTQGLMKYIAYQKILIRK